MLLNTVWFRLIPNQRCIFSSVLPWVSDICFHRPRAVLVFMSRDMKTKQRQNKCFTFPRKLAHKPLLHTMVCKVHSTHQAGTKPWAHALFGQKPHSWISASEGNCVRAKADTNRRQSICSPTFISGSIPQATCTFLLVFCWLLQVSFPKYSMTICEEPEYFSPSLLTFSNKC